jgi:hypothetical protein
MSTTTPLAQYRFGCNAHGTSEVSYDPLLGSLRSTGMEEPSCQFATNGVISATMMESNATVASMRDEFLRTNATGLVLELWMTPSNDVDDSTASTPIFTIGGQQPEPDDDEIGCQGMDLYLAQRGNLLEFRYSDNDAANSCRVLLVRQQALVPDELLQVVLTLNAGETSVYFNGTPIISGARNHFLTNLTTWDPDYTLQLFANHLMASSTTTHFAGSLHQMALYNQAMDAEQVSSLYDRGLQSFHSELDEREPLHLVAYSEPAELAQGRSSSFSIGGYNASSVDWKIMAEITMLPQFGKLLSAEGEIQAPGFRIPLPWNATRTELMYRAWSEDFFTAPGFSYSGQDLAKHSEYFTYRLIAVDVRDDEKVLGWSEPVEQDLVVVHTNHPPSLLVPNYATLPSKQPTDLGSRPMAFLDGIELKDSDQNIDRVRVDVWASNGTLTIPDAFLPLADFESCARRSPWACHGTGVANRNMTFVAEPDDVSSILSNLEYNAFYWDQEDSIVIRIFDGSRGPCLKEEEHQGRFTKDIDFVDGPKVFHTLHQECYQIVTSIQVAAVARMGIGGIEDTKGYFLAFFDFDDFGVADIIFWGVIAVVVLACCFSVRTCIHCWAARGSKVYPEDFNANRGAEAPNHV